MKILKVIFVTFIAMLGMFILISAFMPGEKRIERSIDINAPSEIIYNELSDFHNWKHWEPWPPVQTNISGDPGSQGYKMTWARNKADLAPSSVTLLATGNDMTEHEINYPRYHMGVRQVCKLTDDGSQTKLSLVTILPLPVYMRMMSGKLEEKIAPDTENMLNKLKAYCESDR